MRIEILQRGFKLKSECRLDEELIDNLVKNGIRIENSSKTISDGSRIITFREKVE